MFGTDEYFRSQLPKYVSQSDLIIVGEVYWHDFNQYITVKDVLKGDSRFKGETLLTESTIVIPYVTDVTCGVGKTPSMPDGEFSVAFFDYSTSKLKQLTNKTNPAPIYLGLHIRKNIHLKFKNLLHRTDSIILVLCSLASTMV